MTDNDQHIEYAVLHDNKDNGETWMSEWSCGCERIFSSVEKLLAYYDLEATDTVMCRTVTPWKRWEGQLDDG